MNLNDKALLQRLCMEQKHVLAIAHLPIYFPLLLYMKIHVHATIIRIVVESNIFIIKKDRPKPLRARNDLLPFSIRLQRVTLFRSVVLLYCCFLLPHTQCKSRDNRADQNGK